MTVFREVAEWYAVGPMTSAISPPAGWTREAARSELTASLRSYGRDHTLRTLRRNQESHGCARLSAAWVTGVTRTTSAKAFVPDMDHYQEALLVPDASMGLRAGPAFVSKSCRRSIRTSRAPARTDREGLV